MTESYGNTDMRKRFSRADLHKFLNKDSDASDVMRNHAYSKVGRGGETSGMSLARRREMALQRKTIADYRRSKLGGLHDRPYVPIPKPTSDKAQGAEKQGDPDNTIIGNRQKGGIKDKDRQDTKSIERRHHFIEPPKRNFDKFS